MLSGLHVLLAEDNQTNQMVAVQMLAALGASSSVARNGVEALYLAGSERFDLALIDIEMPQIDGIEVIRRIRTGPEPNASIPLIALTAYVMREHRDAIERAGADGVIAKPILSVEQLGGDILRLLDQRRLFAPRQGPAPGHKASPAAPGTVARAAPPRPPRRSAEPAQRPPPVPAQPGPLEDPRLDLEVFGALSASIGAEAMRELLVRIDSDLEEIRDQIAQGIRSGTFGEIPTATHILMAVAGTVGAVRLHKDSRCLNSAAHSGDLTQVVRLGAKVVEEIEALRSLFRRQVQG